jgi:hypothetical protein
MAQEKYLIRVKGHLGQQWDEWFDGFTITNIEFMSSINREKNYEVQKSLPGD